MDIIHSPETPHSVRRRPRFGLSLVEVIIAIGVFAFAMVTLIGLLGQTLDSLSETLGAGEASAVVSKIETFLQSADDGSGDPVFEQVYRTLSVAPYYVEVVVYTDIDGNSVVTSDTTVVDDAMNNDQAGDNVDGALFVGLVTVSPINPQDTVSATASPLAAPYDGIDAFQLIQPFAAYDLGFLVLEVQVFQFDSPAPGQPLSELIAANPPSDSSGVLNFRTVLNY